MPWRAGTEHKPAMRIESLIEVFDGYVRELVDAGVPPDRIAEALKVAAVRARPLPRADPIQTLLGAAERLQAVASGNVPGEVVGPPAVQEAKGRPERRGPGRPWSRPTPG